ncbi:MAG: N-acetyltransferase family protein, partial [Planctomycetota bacterium]
MNQSRNTDEILIRPAEVCEDSRGGADAIAIAAIYDHYVRNTCITFDETSPDALHFAERIENAGRHPWLVACDSGNRVLGYAMATPHSPRSAYRYAANVTIYLDHQSVGRGIGMRLTGCLLDQMRQQGFRMAISGITLPNPRSRRLHEKLEI